MPGKSYSATMFRDRRTLQRKIMEEAFEVATAKSPDEWTWEIADLLYFLSLLAVDESIEWKEIESELGGRHR